jgi:hypothetical protein
MNQKNSIRLTDGAEKSPGSFRKPLVWCQNMLSMPSLRPILSRLTTLTVMLCLAMTSLALPARASLDVPQVLSYQGRLTDASRITVDDGSYSMKFSLYTASVAGSCLWTASGTCGTPTAVSITVTDGVFSVLLGDTGQNAFDDDLFDSYSTMYLGITIGSDSEMTPRKRVAASAFAMQAGDSDLLDSLNTDNDGCTSACVPVTGSNGNLILTGDPQGTGVSQGSLYINPASTSANETLLGVAVGGAARFRVDEDGDATFGSDNATDTSLTLYNSNNTYASIAGSRYSGYDSISLASSVLDSAYGAAFGYDGLQISASPNTATPLYINETAFDGATDAGANRDDTGLFINTASSMYTTSGAYSASGIKGRNSYTGTGQNATVYGTDMRVTSTPSSTLTTAMGTYSSLTHSGSANLTNGYGVYGIATNASSGTVATSIGVYGVSATSSGTTTNAYGGLFKAAGGSNNYAVYTAEGLVQIEGDATATTPTTATGNGELFVLNDIETNANLDVGGFAGVGLAPTSTETLNVKKDYASVGASNTRKGVYTQTTTTMANGASSNLIGNDTYTAVTDTGGSADMVENLLGVRSSVVHAADGTVTRAYGVTSSVDLSNASGTVTMAIALNGATTNSSLTGTVTNGIGVQAESSGATTNYAMYAGQGYVHIDGSAFGSKTAPTYGPIGNDGTLFLKKSMEIYDGALCVGAAVSGSNSCSGAGTTGGTIYAVNTTVQAHDLAEMFPSHQFLLAGDIVSADSAGDEYVRRTTSADAILGAVSTKPGLTLGWGGENEYPIALTGRTPVKVNGEGGAIAIGDRIAASSVAGVGKKATGEGETVGVAMQAFNGVGDGAVMAFISPEHWNGVAPSSMASSQPEPTIAPTATLADNGVLAVRENRIGNIASLRGYNWSIDEQGVFTTEGSYDVRITSHQGELVTTHALLGLGHFMSLAGTTQMSGDVMVVDFEKVDPKWNDVISATVAPMIVATVSEGGGVVSITRKDQNGFTLQRETGNPTRVDWVAYGYRKGQEPETSLTTVPVVAEEVVAPAVADMSISPETTEALPSTVEESIVAPAPTEAPTTEPIVVTNASTPEVETAASLPPLSDSTLTTTQAATEGTPSSEPATQATTSATSNETL